MHIIVLHTLKQAKEERYTNIDSQLRKIHLAKKLENDQLA